MRKQKLLREELERMRQLMGMNGSLYQKPLFHEQSKKSPPSKFEKGKDPGKGKPAAKPPAAKPKSPPAAKFFAPASEAKPKTGTGSAAALSDGEFVLPMGVVPGMSGPSKGGSSKGGGKGRSARRTKSKRGRRKTTRGKSKTTRTRGKTRTSRGKKTNRRTRKKED